MEPYCIRPLRRNTPCPALTSSPVKTTSPPGSTTRSGIGGCPEYARYARSPSTKKPNRTTSTTAWTQPFEISNPRRPDPAVTNHLRMIPVRADCTTPNYYLISNITFGLTIAQAVRRNAYAMPLEGAYRRQFVRQTL